MALDRRVRAAGGAEERVDGLGVGGAHLTEDDRGGDLVLRRRVAEESDYLANDGDDGDGTDGHVAIIGPARRTSTVNAAGRSISSGSPRARVVSPETGAH